MNYARCLGGQRCPVCQKHSFYWQKHSFIHSLIYHPVDFPWPDTPWPRAMCVWMGVGNSPAWLNVLPSPTHPERACIFLSTGYGGDTVASNMVPGLRTLASGRPQRCCQGVRVLGRAGAGQGCGPASRTCRFIEEGARGAVKTLKAAGVEAHGLLLLPRLTVPGTRGHRDLEEGGHESLSPLSPHSGGLL